MNYTLNGLKSTYCFHNDILIVSKGSEAEHKQYVLKCLKMMKILKSIFQNVIFQN